METEMKEKIISYMRDEVRRPITAESLAEELGVRGAALEPFFEALSELEKTAAVIRNRSGLYGLPERMNLVVGKLSMTGKGYGF
ncbi:MAG: ribonuclease R, partial [Schwartzia sp.]|nr:ribonuclease R [Schwartzia sp. (in: firmicutes)]